MISSHFLSPERNGWLISAMSGAHPTTVCMIGETECIHRPAIRTDFHVFLDDSSSQFLATNIIMKMSFKDCLFEELFQLCSKPKPHISALSQYFLIYSFSISLFSARRQDVPHSRDKINQTRRILQCVFPHNCFSISVCFSRK